MRHCRIPRYEEVIWGHFIYIFKPISLTLNECNFNEKYIFDRSFWYQSPLHFFRRYIVTWRGWICHVTCHLMSISAAVTIDRRSSVEDNLILDCPFIKIISRLSFGRATADRDQNGPADGEWRRPDVSEILFWYYVDRMNMKGDEKL